MTALTNAVSRVVRTQSKPSGTRYYWVYRCVRLEPGLYDLSGVKMASGSHITLAGCKGAIISGLGDRPEDTVLLGGGGTDGVRVIHLGTGDNYTAAGQNMVTNLTITGGYVASASDGGGVVTGGSGYGYVYNCIVSNNYAKGSNGQGGGGIWGSKLVKNCVIANNRAGNGGGLCSCTMAEDCVITNNFAGTGGGVWGGKTLRCLIADNAASYNGGGKTQGFAIDCTFLRNTAQKGGGYGAGGGLHSATATNCVFIGNSDSRSVSCYGSAASDATLVECTATNSLARRSIFNNCRLQRCHVSDVGACANSDVYPFRVFGRSEGKVIYTNANCIVENVTMSNAADRVAVVSTFVNCTIRNSEGKTYGPLNSDCTAVNTIVSGCTPYDVTASTAPIMTNCLYQTASGTFAEGRLVDCVQGNPRYDLESDVPGAIRRSSPAYNAGLGDAWILNLVGETDFAGNPRVKFDRIDIGAVERQSDLLPGLRLSAH